MSGASADGPRRAVARRIDWRRAAELLARGHCLKTVAHQVGCSRSHLSRMRCHDQVFRGWIAEFEAANAARERVSLASLRQAVQEAIANEVKNGNVRVSLWLADRLKLISPPGERTSEDELRGLLGSLSQDELREFEALRDPE